MAPVPFQTVCMRHRTLDTLDIAQRINSSGFAYLTPSVIKGTQLLRVSFGASSTQRADVKALWACCQMPATL
jgi:aromatic-L-amino-acid decarboxylase